MSAETLALRPYQQRTIDKLYAAYGEGRRRVPIVLPTGAGKTVVFSRAAIDCVAAGQPALVLAHRTELIDSAEEALHDSTSGLDVGVLQGRRREAERAVIVASVQTAVRPGALSLLRARRPGLVIVDECHHIAAPSYQTILRELGVFDPAGARLLGVTATLGRADGLALGDTFDGAPAEIVSMGELIDDGYLLRPKGIRVKIEGLDLSRVRTSRTSESGLDDGAVAQAMSDALAPAAIARAVLEHGQGRHGVAFLPSVELSREQARVFAEHGLRSIHVDADTPKVVRKEIIRRAKLGEYDVVCNVGLFTEGTNVPIWDLVIMGRPTSSEVLFAQMAGRGGRPYPGQADFLVLDVVGVTTRHHLRSIVDLEGADPIEPIEPDLLDEYEPDDEPSEQDDSDTSGRNLEPKGADGALVHELIDLFGASHSAWQRSPRGVWFLPLGDGGAVFLAPGPDVDRYEVHTLAGLLHEACDLSAAMAWGDKEARAIAKRELDRAAPWRAKKLTQRERIEAIYRGEAPGGEQAPRTVGALQEQHDARWAVSAIDVLPQVADVSPAGYWTTY